MRVSFISLVANISFVVVLVNMQIPAYLRFDDLLAYKEKMVNRSQAAMDELMMLSQELGIGH